MAKGKPRPNTNAHSSAITLISRPGTLECARPEVQQAMIERSQGRATMRKALGGASAAWLTYLVTAVIL